MPQLRFECGVGGLHVGKEGVPATTLGEHVDLEHGRRRRPLIARDVGMPAVAVGDGGVTVGPDEEHGGVLVLGRSRRVAVEWPQPAGELHVDVRRHHALLPEHQDTVVQERSVEDGERGVVHSVGEVDPPHFGSEYGADGRDPDLRTHGRPEPGC